MLDGQRIIKRIAVLVVVLAALVFFILQLHQNTTTGKVSVTVNRKDGYIKILDQNGLQAGGAEQYSGQKLQKLTERLKPGTYTVLAYTKSSYTNKIITVKARQNLNLSLTLDAADNPEPVLSDGVLSLYASNDELHFIDSRTGNLMEINDEGVSEIDTAHVLKKALWTGTESGVAQDASSNLYVINGDSLNPLPLPFPASNNPSFDFDVAPNGTIYVTNGQDIFAGNATGNFKKVYSSGDNYNIELAASNNAVAFIEKSSSGGSSLVALLTNGTQKRVASNASQLAWSPGGGYLAASDGNKTGNIYDSTLSHRYVLPNVGPNNLLWSGEKSLLYSSSNSVWLYSLSSQQSKVIANLTSSEKISTARVSSDQSYLYFSTDDSTGQLSRIGLKGQAANRSAAILDVFLPEDVGVCSLDYINFIKPIITVSYPTLSTTSDLCIEAAKGALRYYNLDPGKFQYQAASFVEKDAD